MVKIMILKKLVSYFLYTNLFFWAVLSSIEAEAHQLSVLVGPSFETIKIKNSTKSRLTVTSFMAQYERNVVNNVYFSLGIASQLDIVTINVVSFGLYGSGRYYLIGKPDRRESTSEGTMLSLTYPYSLYVGLGAFNKQVDFEGEEKQNVGGLILQTGGTLQYKKNMYLNWMLNYLYQGEKNRVSYSNIEAYFGIGFWL